MGVRSKLGPRYAAVCATVFAVVLSCGVALQAQSSGTHEQLKRLVDENSVQWKQVSKEIWDFAELGYHEEKSSALLQQQLKAAGFAVQSGVADEPTAFVASYGQGKPVIAILGEFDALPGLSQQAVPERAPVTTGAPGHACGHNLLGAGAALAVVAVRQYMERNHISGTLRYYGTPAEEGGGGKVFMVRAGLFKDVDVVLHWHPGDRNEVTDGGALAMTEAKFTFHGVAAHAAMAPDRGRSALDAVMLMGTGIEYMREHVPSNTRIHYIITKGGAAANIVPDLAQMEVVARHPSNTTLQEIWNRIVDVAEGAALMTGTTYEISDIGGYANIISNDALGTVLQKNLEEVGGYTMSEDERKFATELQKTLKVDSPPTLDMTYGIEPLRRPDLNAPAASTDVGDVSWVVPTIGFTTTTFVPGVAPHTWQSAASAGMSIGQDGMVVAAKALALTAVDLFTNVQLVQAAKTNFATELAGKTYHSAVPEAQKPPIDYRGK